MKKGLGRGLDSLFGVYENVEENEIKPQSNVNNIVLTGNETVIDMPINEIDTNIDQPRKNFDETALK